MKLKALSCSIAITLAALKFVDANAMSVSETVLASQSVLLQQSGADMISFKAPGPGELFVTLTDLQFPTAFSSLQYGLTDTSALDTGMIGAGVTTTEALTGPTIVDANIFAKLGGSAGLFNFTATFLPNSATVPLPASAVSMVGGLLMLWGMARRPRPEAHIAHSPE